MKKSAKSKPVTAADRPHLVVRLMSEKDKIPRGTATFSVDIPKLHLVLFQLDGAHAESLTLAEFEALGTEAEDTLNEALNNVAEAVPLKVETMEHGIWALSNDEIGFVSGYAPVLTQIPGLPRPGKNGLLVGFPNAHLIVVLPVSQKTLPTALPALVQGVVGSFEDADEPLSRDLYWLRKDEWVHLPVGRSRKNPTVDLPRELQTLVAPRPKARAPKRT